MKAARFTSLAALVSFALAAAGSHAADAATAKLLECMKLEAASPKQEACMRDVQALGSAPKPAAAATRASAVAPAGGKPLPGPAQPAQMQLAAAPPGVRHGVAAPKLEDNDRLACPQAEQKGTALNSEPDV